MSNTGYRAYTDLEQYYINSNIATGVTKTNSSSDPDYVAPFYDTGSCPLPSASPSATPSATPSISVTPSVTPTVTPTVTPSTSIIATPSNTPTISVTPSITPTITITPTKTPTPTPSSSTPTSYYYYSADRYECINGYCTWVESTIIANPTEIIVDNGRYYYDYNNCYIFTVANSISPTTALITNITDVGTKNCSALCNIICGNTP